LAEKIEGYQGRPIRLPGGRKGVENERLPMQAESCVRSDYLRREILQSVVGGGKKEKEKESGRWGRARKEEVNNNEVVEMK
jgi:hypothetical protein